MWKEFKEENESTFEELSCSSSMEMAISYEPLMPNMATTVMIVAYVLISHASFWFSFQ